MSDHPEKKLLSDDEWAELMSQDYEAQGSPVDALGQKRAWRQIEKKIRARKWARPLASLAAAAVIVTIFGITQIGPHPNYWRDKGDAPRISVALATYILGPNGTTTPTSEESLPPGATVVFKARTTQTSVYALLVTENDQDPRLAIEDGQLAGGDEQFLMKNDNIYGETIGPGERLKVCLVASLDQDSLKRELQDLHRLMPTLPPESCVSLKAGVP